MHRFATLLILLALSTAPASASVPVLALQAAAPRAPTVDAAAAKAPDVVVLVHGLGRTKLSMLPLEWSLERAGFEVLNWGYWSTCCSVRELATSLAEEIDSHPEYRDRRIHFVGHSLGGIVVRGLLASDPPFQLGRVVMLAPPNRGSELADRYARLLGWLLRPLPEITTEDTSLARRLPPPRDVQIGIIAGLYDGKVSVAESHLPGESAHVVVPSAHTFIMNRGDVHRLVTSFLLEGTFREASVLR